VIVLCNRETQLTAPAKLAHVEFADPPVRHGYLIEASSGSELLPYLPEEKQLGISRPFTGSTEFDAAGKEALLAYFQKFINGKNGNVYSGQFAMEQSISLIQDLQSRCYCRDLAGAHEIFQRIETLFATDSLTIRSAQRLYQSMLFVFADGAKDCETYEQLCAQFADVGAMLHEIEKNLIADLAGSHSLPERRSAIGSILCYVNEHYFDYNLTMQALSEKFDLNANYISQLLRKSSAESFTKYLTSVRMAHAKDLLEKSQDTIKAVGEKVGYADYFYFAKVFKKIVHQTPGEYRAAHSEFPQKEEQPEEE
jgi:Response regulator containing CheY-like receiver domain and AraC-type DNA-binding domain